MKSELSLQKARQCFRNGELSYIQYCLIAAAYYKANHKPRRAHALLECIDSTQCRSEQMQHYRSLMQSDTKIKSLPPPVCSLNMIVKNEARCIGEALDSVDEIMEEIVICDTGSTDETVAIAQLYGVIILYDTWCNDFSRARNKALEGSSGKWVFWLDADDRLDTKSSNVLQEIWKQKELKALACCISNERKGSGATQFLQVRLFPRLPGVCFQQRVHEQVMFSLAEKNIPCIAEPRIRILHYGYHDPLVRRKKAARNKPLIIEELANKPSDPVLHSNLADALFILGNYEAALKEYLWIVNNDSVRHDHADIYIQALYNCAQLYMVQKNPIEAKRYLVRCLYYDNKRADALFALGKIYYDENRYHDALSYFLRGSRIIPPLRMTPVNGLKAKLESIYYTAKILIHWRRFAEAERILLQATHCFPLIPQYYTLLGEIVLTRQQLREAARYFSLSLSLAPMHNKEACKGMASVYTRIGDMKTAEKYTKQGENSSLFHPAVSAVLSSGTPVLDEIKKTSLQSSKHQIG